MPPSPCKQKDPREAVGGVLLVDRICPNPDAEVSAELTSPPRQVQRRIEQDRGLVSGYWGDIARRTGLPCEEAQVEHEPAGDRGRDSAARHTSHRLREATGGGGAPDEAGEVGGVPLLPFLVAETVTTEIYTLSLHDALPI